MNQPGLEVMHPFFIKKNFTTLRKTLFPLKVLIVQNCDNDILEGMVITNPPQTQNPLFLS
jgi:hypothetical protein